MTIQYLCLITKYNNFLGACWFLVKTLSNFVSLLCKLDNQNNSIVHIKESFSNYLRCFFAKITIFPHFFFRCANNAMIGMPHKITTVDKFQGQQNDYILLSLVRTRNIGHLRYASKAFFFTWGIFQWLRGHEEGQVVKNACPCSAFKILKQGQIVVSAFIWLCF